MANFATATESAGDPVAGTASWARVDADATATVAAANGDKVLVIVKAVVPKGRGRLLLDVASIVSSAIVNRAGGTLGSEQVDPSNDEDFASRAQGDRVVTMLAVFSVVTGDISGGNVALTPVIKGTGKVKRTSGLTITAVNLTKGIAA